MSAILTETSLYSLGAVVAVLAAAYVLAAKLLPSSSGSKETAIFTWLAFDALIHFSFEGSFLYLSVFGRTVQASHGPFATMWKEYALADSRWGLADPNIVSIELLTVLGAGPLCCYILYLLARGDSIAHYWIIVLCTAEIYGGWMTFCPEWLVGSPSLDTSNPLYTYVYLALMNLLWVFIPLWLMFDSYGFLKRALGNNKTSTRQKTQ